MPIWRNIPILRNPLSPPPHLALCFHSTPVSLAKGKIKWSHQEEGRGGQSSKNYIRYAVRQKRADAKKALKDLLLNGRSPKLSFQDEEITWRADKIKSRNFNFEDSSHDFNDQPQSKNSGKSKPHRSLSGKGKRSGNKRRKNNQSFYSEDDEGHPETNFQATFGNRSYTWSFRPWNDSHFQKSTAGLEWRDGSNWTRNRRVWENSESDDDSNWVKNKRRSWETSESDDDESSTTGLHSHRIMLGLPPRGPLKLDDVKNAFRVSALKWHPDKHQGQSQSIAEEKFKLCVDAYKSLCNALNSA